VHVLVFVAPVRCIFPCMPIIWMDVCVGGFFRGGLHGTAGFRCHGCGGAVDIHGGQALENLSFWRNFRGNAHAQVASSHLAN